jgi:hypothetical protein
MIRRWGCVLLLFAAARSAVAADEYAVAAIDSGPPADAVSKDIAAELAATGLKVTSGSKTVCEIWLAKSSAAKADFKPSDTVLYPFEPGQLIGVLRFRAKGSDFRDQEIARGTYTLRYGQQPVDGNHVGTSPTRDFLLLVSAKKDTSPKPLDEKTLVQLSAELPARSIPR